MLAETLTIRFAFAVKEPSETCSTIVLSPVVAAQSAAMSAVIVPPVLTMLVTVRPVGTVVAVTVKLPAAVSLSLTVAICELLAAMPCCRDKPV